jgi:hypothetical protein
MNVFPIGSPGAEANQNKWEIRIDGLYEVKPFHPKKQLHQPLKDIIILEYFRTSGDAIAKLAALEQDLWALAGAVRALSNLAKKTRGDSRWLEVGITGDKEIMCQPKSLRDERIARKLKELK